MRKEPSIFLKQQETRQYARNSRGLTHCCEKVVTQRFLSYQVCICHRDAARAFTSAALDLLGALQFFLMQYIGSSCHHKVLISIPAADYGSLAMHASRMIK